MNEVKIISESNDHAITSHEKARVDETGALISANLGTNGWYLTREGLCARMVISGARWNVSPETDLGFKDISVDEIYKAVPPKDGEDNPSYEKITEAKIGDVVFVHLSKYGFISAAVRGRYWYATSPIDRRYTRVTSTLFATKKAALAYAKATGKAAENCAACKCQSLEAIIGNTVDELKAMRDKINKLISALAQPED